MVPGCTTVMAGTAPGQPSLISAVVPAAPRRIRTILARVLEGRLGNGLPSRTAGICAGTQRIRLLSVTGFPVSPRPRLAEFTVHG